MKRTKLKIRMSTRLSLAYVIGVIVAVGIAVWGLYYYNSLRTYKEGRVTLIQLTETTMTQVDSRLTNMEQTIIDILSNRDFITSWQTFQVSPYEEERNSVKRILTDGYKNRSDIRRVAVYDAAGRYIVTGVKSINQRDINKYVQDVNKIEELELINGRVFLGPRIDFWNPETGVEVITQIRPIKDRLGKVLGYIEVQQNCFYIERICDVKWGDERLKTIILWGHDNDMLYQSDDKKLSEADLGLYAKMVDEYTQYKDFPDEVAAMADSNFYDCRMILALPKDLLYHSVRETMRWIMALAALLVIGTVFYIILVTRVNMRPFNQFLKRMQDTDLNCMRPSSEVAKTDWETQTLIDSYDDMTSRLKKSLEKQSKLLEVQTKTVFGVLQSEISPHFLYNTLGSIANMCERGDSDEAANACYSLTEILRYTSNYTTAEVTVGEEIENLFAYFAIMKSRYRQRFIYEIELDDRVKNVGLPKLTLQPIVENAIKYSLLETETVAVKVYVIYFIEVKDNGKGMSLEDIEKIKGRVEGFQDDESAKDIIEQIQFGGMGLSGTLIRLSIFFGEDFEYTFLGQNDEGGTTVVLRMKVED